MNRRKAESCTSHGSTEPSSNFANGVLAPNRKAEAMESQMPRCIFYCFHLFEGLHWVVPDGL
jgi:hypothetical protein